MTHLPVKYTYEWKPWDPSQSGTKRAAARLLLLLTRLLFSSISNPFFIYHSFSSFSLILFYIFLFYLSISHLLHPPIYPAPLNLSLFSLFLKIPPLFTLYFFILPNPLTYFHPLGENSYSVCPQYPSIWTHCKYS